MIIDVWIAIASNATDPGKKFVELYQKLAVVNVNKNTPICS